MATGVDGGSRGSFDDVPDAELRTVLAIPLSLPPAPASAPAHQDQPVARHSRPARLRPPTEGVLGAVWVGLGAAATVFVAVVLVLLAVQVALD